MSVCVGVATVAAVALRARRRAAWEPPRSPKLGLHPGESRGEGLARMAAEQVKLASRSLREAGGGAAGAASAVHEARKAVKRLRTIDRLREPALTGKVRKRRTKALRAVAEALAEARDAEVLATTLASTLASMERRSASRSGVMRLREKVEAERVAAEMALWNAGDARIATALSALRRIDSSSKRSAEASKRSPQPSKRSPGVASGKALEAGLRKIYARGRRAMRRALTTRDAADMHEWRKRVKDLRYATEALAPLDGEGDERSVLRKVSRRADRLGEALGEDHDLAILAARVKAERRLFKDDRKGQRALLKAVRRRRKKLRSQAKKLGRKLYAEKPKRFGKEVHHPDSTRLQLFR